MILDNHKNIDKYSSIHPNFKKAFDFIKNYQSGKLQDGKYEILGDEVFAIVAQIKNYEAITQLEAHRKYIDVQYVVEGEDVIGWKNIQDCDHPVGEFNMEDDYILFSDEPIFKFTLSKGYFAIFYPDDAHGPLMGNSSMKKIVVKVRIEE